MKVLDVTPILNVSSLRDSVAWFEQLGWKKHWEFGDPPNFGAVISDGDVFRVSARLEEEE